ncbi:hypothetical protein GMLC_36340 [Geomonas limicola]|uniref:histidine kinase n=1 Tax=Geomonas limicola TaxID=2740186 RepID=A0A6V8NBQ6_9BACT|nr:PAS domain-containing sensor histidine kinase [Geomonas limicola]GFO70055.1 hypothetical protein GMLC_36340 [Geomonas limicola]
MGGFSLTTAMVIACLMSLMIFGFLVALSRGQRSGQFSTSYRLLGIAYLFNGLRLICQLLSVASLPGLTIAGDFCYLAFITTFWFGMRLYVRPEPANRRLVLVPALLFAWILFSRLTGVPIPWLFVPQHAVGTGIFLLSGYHVWRLHRERTNYDLLVLALMMWTQGISTATYPFTRHTWYAPYGFALFALLASAIGMGLMVAALREEQRELETEIAARREAEKTREESLAFIETLLAESPTGIVVFEGTTGECVHANSRIAEMIGGPVESVRGQNFRSIESWQRGAVTAVAEQTLRDGITRSAELNQETSFGKSVFLECYLSRFTVDGISYLLVVASDISERKRSEALLRESEDRLRSILKTAIDGFWILDPQGRVLEVNDSYCRMSGYAKEELLGEQIGLVEDVELAEETTAHIRRLKDLGKERFETRHRRKDGSSFEVEVSVQYLPSGMFVAFIRDLSQRKTDEAERRRLEEQLQQSLKMESVGRLAGGVAHDFNNMLSVIIGHANLALMRLEKGDGQKLRSDLDQIGKAAERSAGLTRQLLAFARKQTIAPKSLDMNLAVKGMLGMLRRIIGENIELSWNPAAGLWPVKMDPSQLDQVLANLCVNARDAIRDVGRIVIEVANRSFDGNYRATHLEVLGTDYVLLTVRDDGCGMDPETLPHIFEPFFTTKALGEGTGLGLATVYGIVKQNDGFIDVASEPGVGTTFSIYLPRHLEAGESLALPERERVAEGGDETILLVEDEPAILDMATQILAGQGYRVLTAQAPGEAIALMLEHRGVVDLLVTDVVMPEMNGRDLAQSLKKLNPELRCLFISGYTADIIAPHGLLEPGVCFLEKPFNLGDLAAKVREVLDGVVISS